MLVYTIGDVIGLATGAFLLAAIGVVLAVQWVLELWRRIAGRKRKGGWMS
jgi:uncharacterized membrane protein HdeD (DUF308 family)